MDKTSTMKNILKTDPRHVLTHLWFGTFRIFGWSIEAKGQVRGWGYLELVVVVVFFIFQYGNIHLHTSGSIFINKNIFEKKTNWKSEIAYQNKS